MGAVQPYIQCGPPTYTANVAITGGQLVEPDGTTGRIKPATAGSLVVLGVAWDDAAPAGSGSPTNFASARPDVAVHAAPSEVRVTYAANAAFGVKLIAAANGQVTPAGATPDARSIVGYCAEPAGVTSGGVGRMKIA